MSEPTELVTELPVEDLTERVSNRNANASYPFDGNADFERLFDAIARALYKRKGNHVLLTGERGVGKSTIMAELARRAATGRIQFLKNRRFVTVNCRHVSPDESRVVLAGVLESLGARAELVVCIDGFAQLLRSDRGPNNKEMLLSILSQCQCQVIGLLSGRDFEELLSDDQDVPDYFTRIDVPEPDIDVATELVRHLARGLGNAFALTIDDEVTRQAVLLSTNYILNDQLPAKAVKVLHRACEDVDYERTQLGHTRNHLTTDDVIRMVSRTSGVPEETLRGIAEHSDYECGLREVIFGQDNAVREVANELGLIKTGLTDPTKPASVMLFIGQTGVGKTELAKALARFYSSSKRLKVYALGNCVEPHSVSTLIGVPPGYVGHDQGGRLVNELNSDPYGVFLLDEADKAHPDVLQPFLNLFDEGWICDQRGVRAYANKSIFILTTNVGQRMIAEMVQQGKSAEEIASRMKEALSQIRHTKSDRPVFTPEFLARIKRVIVFAPLDSGAVRNIARKLIVELENSWMAKRGKELVIPPELLEAVAARAHALNDASKGREGGRIVRKLISDWIEVPIQREIVTHPDKYTSANCVQLNVRPAEKEGEMPYVVVEFGTPNGVPSSSETGPNDMPGVEVPISEPALASE